MNKVVEICKLLPEGGFNTIEYMKCAFTGKLDSTQQKATDLRREVSEELFKDLQDRFSTVYIDDKLKDIICQYSLGAGMSISKGDIRKALDQMMKDYDNWSHVRDILVPVYGIEMPMNKGRVNVGNFSFWRQKPLLTYLRKEFTKSKMAKKWKKHFKYTAMAIRESKVWCSYSKKGEPTRAKELAFEHTEQCMNVMQYFAGANARWIDVPILSAFRKSNRLTKTHIFLSHDSQWVGSGGQHCKLPQMIKLDKKTIAGMKKMELDEVMSWIPLKFSNAERKTGIRHSILRAIWHFSEGERETDMNKALLHYVACLDTLLAKKKSGMASDIGYALAFLLYDKLTSRQEVIDFSKKVYNFRNDIIHNGDKPATEGYIRAVRRYCGEAVLQVIARRNEWQDSSEMFEKWVESEKLKVKA